MSISTADFDSHSVLADWQVHLACREGPVSVSVDVGVIEAGVNIDRLLFDPTKLPLQECAFSGDGLRNCRGALSAWTEAIQFPSTDALGAGPHERGRP